MNNKLDYIFTFDTDGIQFTVNFLNMRLYDTLSNKYTAIFKDREGKDGDWRLFLNYKSSHKVQEYIEQLYNKFLRQAKDIYPSSDFIFNKMNLSNEGHKTREKRYVIMFDQMLLLDTATKKIIALKRCGDNLWYANEKEFTSFVCLNGNCSSELEKLYKRFTLDQCIEDMLAR